MIHYLACMLTVASIAHLPPRVLPVIETLEGGGIKAKFVEEKKTPDVIKITLEDISLAVSRVLRSDKKTTTLSGRPSQNCGETAIKSS